MFITWFIIFAAITGVILYCNRDEFYEPSDWLGAFLMCLLCVGVILLFIFAIGSEIATSSCELECTTTTIGAVADSNNAVIITRDMDTEVTIAVFDVTGKLDTIELEYDDCMFENSTTNIVEQHKYTFANKITRVFFSYTNGIEYTIKTTDSHIVDGTRIG